MFDDAKIEISAQLINCLKVFLNTRFKFSRLLGRADISALFYADKFFPFGLCIMR